ncbi:Fe-S cluster assembly protein dre2 [Talaromyces atroroseus]|uniref:Fe-S cluster assembly protein dre2 n=1 Tax=Talaromyces atroroseus TaxID=1441469 RepID=A0A225AJ23_TALAT|nr:Fe-S cluster assembly protein dre2 [Talaromyces atroroseus]OKL61461.1 Fe-S cluster assembly protein dre2 [Talaromyces atroroseus]
MPSLPVLVDTTPDLDFSDFSPAQNVNQKRSLLLAPPSIAAHEDKLRDVFATFDRSVTDLQMLDRLSAGFVALPPSTYDLVLVLTDANGARRNEALELLNRGVYNILMPSMKHGAKLELQDGPFGGNDGREAILAGLVEKDGAFEKPEYQEVVVPLRFGANKKKNKAAPEPVKPQNVGFVDYKDDDELIDEDGLLSEDDLSRPVQLPAECQPETAKKRRRACKDCTCGLAAQLEAEDAARREQANKDLSVLKLNTDELNDEVDFTVQGKTGSCNSCSLGDAFRCATCPFIGLPAFKPGEEVKIMNDMAQL